MRRDALPVGVLLLLLSLSGCAFTTATLNVDYDGTKTSKGPLSSVKSLGIDIGEFLDKRQETDKIGYKKNGFGQKTANILTTKPVAQIVREALIAEFSKNGFLVGGGEKDVTLSGEITVFWFDTQINFWSVEFMGTVNVNVNVLNGKTGTVLLSRKYQGHYNEKSLGGLDATWERVMNTALERMMEEVRTDTLLVQKLKEL